MQLICALLATVTLAPAAARAQDHVRIALDAMAYADTDGVVVISPQLAVRHDLDAEGGAVSGRAVVDVVSAASVDVVTQATDRFDEVRTEGSLSLSKAFGDHLPSISYRASVEPDWVSHGVVAGLESRLGTPDTTLRLSYGLTLDHIGRSGTPWSAFDERLTTHAAELSLTQVLSPRLVLRAVASLTVQHGYLEKPYRYVPLFDAAAIQSAAADGVRIDLSSFDRYRLPARPPEEVPDRRVRPAFALRLLRYLPRARAALRIDYRLYADDWGVVSNTLEPSFEGTYGPGLVLGAFLRFYRQREASFWRERYVVEDARSVPRFRSVDRELSRYVTLTRGLLFGYLVE
jgi:hypothetical protein